MGSDRRPNDGAWGGGSQGPEGGYGGRRGSSQEEEGMGAKEEPRKNKNGAQHQLPRPRNRNPTSRSRQVLRSFPGVGVGGHPLRVPTFRKDCFPCHHQGGRSGGLRGLWWGPRRVWVWGKLREATRQGKQEAATGPQPEGSSGHGADTGRCWALGADSCRSLGAHRLALPGLSPLL